MDDSQPGPSLVLLNGFLDSFFHLPTLILWTLIALVLLWQTYDIGLRINDDSIRLNSNRGYVILTWVHGCCELNW